MDEIRRIAEKQYMDAMESGDMEDCVGFEFEGQFIINPWIDPSGRFDLSTKEATKLYGEKNIIAFCEDIADIYDL